MSRSTSRCMRLQPTRARLLGDESGDGGRGVRPQYPEPHIPFGLGGGCGRNASS